MSETNRVHAVPPMISAEVFGAVAEISEEHPDAYRINDGELVWYWAASNISRRRASPIADANRLRAELPDSALHFERIESLPKSAFKQPTYSSLQGPVLNESA